MNEDLAYLSSDEDQLYEPSKAALNPFQKRARIAAKYLYDATHDEGFASNMEETLLMHMEHHKTNLQVDLLVLSLTILHTMGVAFDRSSPAVEARNMETLTRLVLDGIRYESDPEQISKAVNETLNMFVSG